MNVVPAQVAGVGSIAVTSPPQKEFGGRPHPAILAACALLGVGEVYAAGGAQAIAMFAYGYRSAGGDGTGGCRRADLVVANGYAAEHLEIQTRDAAAVAARVRNAGAIFIGPYAPVSLGDYCAGSNHVLPTGGCACHSSGLSVQSFLRGIHVVDYSREALADVAAHVVNLANAEDLPGHGDAIRARFDWTVPGQ